MKKSDQRSRSFLDLTVQIQSRFRISPNRHSCCIVFFAFWIRDPRNSDTGYDQRSRYDLDSTTTIESRYRISRNRGFCCRMFLSLQNPDSRNSDKELNQWSRSLLILTAAIKSRNRTLLILTAAIKSQNCVSQFWGSWCQVILAFQSPDPRYSDSD